MSWTKRWRKRVRALTQRDAVERELEEELRFHLEMETRKNLAAGMSPGEARRRAALAFGGVQKYTEEVRDARALGWVSGLSLDFKLGLRMLRRYPGLTLVGGLALAFAIGVGAATFEVVTQLVHPRLPLEEGDRIVGIRTWDVEAGGVEGSAASDFAAWREGLASIDDLGAFRPVQRNLIVPGGPAEPVAGAEMTASGFRVARVPPLLGRYLVEDDERGDAPPVVVIGHDLWRTRFGGDPAVIGREVRLGETPHTVVGVMPEGFAFPSNERMWVPLRLEPSRYGPGEGPRILVFGRLAPGVSLDAAGAELATLGRRAAADSPETHEHLRPEVVPYARLILGVPWGLLRGTAYSTNAAVLLFLLLVCANVATLVFARTATREGELVVRTALGASRSRIVAQLFAEALVLGGLAATLGIAFAAFGLRWGIATFESVGDYVPFWIDGSLSPRTVAYAALLAVVAAVVAGVVPALKMTGRGGEKRLRQAAAGGSSVRFGRLWTGIIVTQVALTAAVVPVVVDASLDTDTIRKTEAGFAADEYLSASLAMDRPAAGEPEETPPAATVHPTFTELRQRLAAEPGVTGVTFASRVPGGSHPLRRIRMEDESLAPAPGVDPRMQLSAVAPDFFQVIGTRVVSGRGFLAGDPGADRQAVVVNESFVEVVLGGRNPIGQRLRYPDVREHDAASPDQWYEIVGVVRDVIMMVDPDLDHNAGIYHRADLSGGASIHAIVHVPEGPPAFAPRLRALATAVDPTLRLYDVKSVDEARRDVLTTYRFWVGTAFAACGVILLLSILGIHSIMAFTVSRRRREIGIRVALGADRPRVIREILSRALVQVGLGIAAGTGLIVVLVGGLDSMREVGLLSGSVGLMLAATAVACFVPTRRALDVQPTEAMRADA